MIRVQEPAADGNANKAVLDALARAIGVPRRDVRLISGTTSRQKIVEVDGADPVVLETLLER
jgi:uncharacterized protein YggU (UPF0235/DUF167 family)